MREGAGDTESSIKCKQSEEREGHALSDEPSMYGKKWNEARVHVVIPLPMFVARPIAVPARIFGYRMYLVLEQWLCHCSKVNPYSRKVRQWLVCHVTVWSSLQLRFASIGMHRMRGHAAWRGR